MIKKRTLTTMQAAKALLREQGLPPPIIGVGEKHSLEIRRELWVQFKQMTEETLGWKVKEAIEDALTLWLEEMEHLFKHKKPPGG